MSLVAELQASCSFICEGLFWVCHACSVSLGLESRTSLVDEESLVHHKGVRCEAESEGSENQNNV